jgi:NADPH-dependent 2,4-dienoyl-CoA reductase/sulfur reductase-like enzyme/peroxiredoxin family protein/TusA-related sulfurtransferase/rhodanese-related sulfurtransferase
MAPKKIVIVGGVAGGASAATRLRRLDEDAEIILFERGEYVSFANCGLPYYIGRSIAERDRLLVQTPEGFHDLYNIDVRVLSEVVEIDRQRQEVVVRNLVDNTESRESYDALILSPGAEPVRPPIPGVKSKRVLTLRNMADMDAVDRLLGQDKPMRSVVIGGGYIGLEMAEALRQRGLEVTLVELANQVMGPADPEMVAPIHQELMLHGVDLRLETSVNQFSDEGELLNILLSTGETISCELAILAIGVRPDVGLARDAGLEIGRLGGIVVDDNMRTVDPNIYAVGDAIEVRDFVSGREAVVPLAGPANRQGRIAADNICGRESVYKNTQGTAICKVFNQVIGMTGLSEKALRQAGIDYEKIYIYPRDHAGYYPGSSTMVLKLLFEPNDGRVLGAQAAGSAGIDKRIDVLATAIRGEMTVFDLEELELAYAPPYGSAKDPVNYAGFVAANSIRGDVALAHVEDIAEPTDRQGILDVREVEESALGTIPGAINIRLEELRDRIGELSKEKSWLVFCRVGLRGYLACRILMKNGFECRNLSGGYKIYHMATGKPTNLSNISKESVQNMSDQGDKKVISTGSKQKEITPVKRIDACGLQCPGPILRLKSEIDTIGDGQTLSIIATDAGFVADVSAWCNVTGNELVEIVSEKSGCRATVTKRAEQISPSAVSTPTGKKGLTIVVFSNAFDKAIAAFIIANGAAAMGYEVTLFFTFWGLNVLRKDAPQRVKKTFIERMFGWMMPRGPEKLALSQMNMAGMGLAMIKGIMRKKNVTSLPESIDAAKNSGVRLVACSMSMDLMGIKNEELIDGVEDGGVAMYLDQAGQGNVNLFI